MLSRGNVIHSFRDIQKTSQVQAAIVFLKLDSEYMGDLLLLF